MTPAQFRNALQRVADDAWPGAGVEVSVQVWRPDGQCPHCQVALERPRHHETGAPGATYRRAFELSGGRCALRIRCMSAASRPMWGERRIAADQGVIPWLS